MEPFSKAKIATQILHGSPLLLPRDSSSFMSSKTFLEHSLNVSAIIVLGRVVKGGTSQIDICGGLVAYVASRFTFSRFLPLP